MHCMHYTLNNEQLSLSTYGKMSLPILQTSFDSPHVPMIFLKIKGSLNKPRPFRIFHALGFKKTDTLTLNFL